MHPPALHLYTDSSPNGFKISIALEELGLPYRLHHVRIDEGEHRQPAFLKLNPHGRIPALVDHDTGVTLFESAAILAVSGRKIRPPASRRTRPAMGRHRVADVPQRQHGSRAGPARAL